MPKKKSSTTVSSKAGKRRPRSPVAKRARRSRDDILSRIIKAASQEFRRCGFAGTTTATIARKADVTEAQLFRYFGSKANLFRETIFKPINQHFVSFMDRHMPHGGKPGSRELTTLYASELQHFIREHSEMLTSLVVAQTYDDGSAHGVGEIDSLRTYFERGASLMATRIKGKAKVDPHLIVRVTFATVLACVMFKDWIFPADLAKSEKIQAAINHFIMEGINTNFTRAPG